MGTYRQPDIIKDSMGVLAMAKGVATVQASFQKTFDDLNKASVANAEKTRKQEEKRLKAKWKDANKINKELADAGLLGADQPSSTKQVVREIKDMYYSCSGGGGSDSLTALECSELQAYLLTLPDEIANGIGVQGSLSEEYDKIMQNSPGEPNSLDLDRVDNNNYIFGREFAENGGKNVRCKINPDTKQIYWEIEPTTYTAKEMAAMTPEEREEILDGAEYKGGNFTVKDSGGIIYNSALLKTQLDPKNPIPFFPTHGDPSEVTNIMHNGGGGAPGLGVGFKGDKNGGVLTIKKGDTKTEITDPKEINVELQKRLNEYDFTNTLNSNGAINLYNGAIAKNIKRLELIQNKPIDQLTDTEKRLAETWYGENWEKNLREHTTDEGDNIRTYKERGASPFGPWEGSDEQLAETVPVLQTQRDILENGLRLDYEEKYMLTEPPTVEEEDLAGTSTNIGSFTEEGPGKMKIDEEVEIEFDVNTAANKFQGGLKVITTEETTPEETTIEETIAEETPTEEEVTTEDETKDETKDEDKEWRNYGGYATRDKDKNISLVYTDSTGKSKTIPTGKMKNKILKTNTGDGKDYIRDIMNFENSMGDFDGNSVSNYGFSGTGGKGSKGEALLKEFNKVKGTKEEKALATIDKYIIGDGPDDPLVGGVKGNTTILHDLQMTRAEFDKLPDEVKKELVDWKFNSGRNTRDLIKTANDKSSWSGVDAHQKTSPTNDEIKTIDIKGLTKDKLTSGRHELYKGRITSLKQMIAAEKDPKKKKELQSDLTLAEKGYKNSQQYRR